MRKVLFHALVLVAVASMASAAGDGQSKRLLTANDARGWEAVGRLDMGGVAYCTGALIAPDLVLTAGHCMFEPDSHRRFRPGEITFSAGLRGGHANARAGVAQVVVHPGFAFDDGSGAATVENDVALLRLDAPIRKTHVHPFDTAPRPRKGDAVAVVSYGRSRSETPVLQKGCKVLARRLSTLVLSCSVEFGSSGAPVFTIDRTGRAHIVSVISAKSEINGRAVALGMRLASPLADVMALMASSEPPETGRASAAHVISLGGGKAARGGNGGHGGAKFVRP